VYDAVRPRLSSVVYDAVRPRLSSVVYDAVRPRLSSVVYDAVRPRLSSVVYDALRPRLVYHAGNHDCSQWCKRRVVPAIEEGRGVCVQLRELAQTEKYSLAN